MDVVVLERISNGCHAFGEDLHWKFPECFRSVFGVILRVSGSFRRVSGVFLRVSERCRRVPRVPLRVSGEDFQ